MEYRKTNSPIGRSSGGYEQRVRDFGNINLRELQDFDPLLTEGSRVLREFDFKNYTSFIDDKENIHRSEDPESIHARIIEQMVNRERVIKVELTSSLDIFFYYVHMFTN
jgi:hypothetical protein